MKINEDLTKVDLKFRKLGYLKEEDEKRGFITYYFEGDANRFIKFKLYTGKRSWEKQVRSNMYLTYEEVKVIEEKAKELGW